MQYIDRTLRWAGIAVLLACGALAAPALRAAEAPSYRVAVADLDLGTAAGRDTLAARVRAAATTACGLQDTRGYARRQQARRCVDATVAATVAELRRATPSTGLLAAN